MDTKSTFTPKPYNYGPLANYTVTWYDGTTTDLKVHNIDYPARNIDIHDRSYGTARHVRFFASLDGRWTMVLSAPEHNIRKVEFTGYDPEVEAETTDEPEDGPDPRDNAIPADEITKSGILATPIDSLLNSGADDDQPRGLLHVLETIENGVTTSRETYTF